MGNDRKSSESSTTQTVQRFPEEQELAKLELARQRAAQGGIIAAQGAGLDLVNQLLTGQQLPGQLQGLFGGITPEITEEIAQESIKDLLPSFQQSGILDSGVAASIAGRTAGDIRRQSAQFNLQNRLQLLNQAIGGQAQVQQPIMTGAASLGSRLAPKVLTQQQSATYRQNPFMQAFSRATGSFSPGAANPFSIGF